jgi:uncharacterized UBP type Zn finger protein
VLDVFDFCNDTIKSQLSIGKKEELRMKEEETNAMLNKKEDSKEEVKVQPKKEKKPETGINLPDDVIYAAQGTGLPNGKYHLVGVLTHQGLSSDGGHYMSWTHFQQNEWARIDDEIVGPVDTDEIHKLAGGKDCPMSYLMLYRRLEVHIPKPK